jgi:nitrite reductase (NADH) small subunit
VGQWVRLCSRAEAPQPGSVLETEAGGKVFCVGNLRGELHALNGICPHRGGPLGQGWMNGESVVCPWHAWRFNLKTGVAAHPVTQQVRVYPVKVEGDDVLLELP